MLYGEIDDWERISTVYTISFEAEEEKSKENIERVSVRVMWGEDDLWCFLLIFGGKDDKARVIQNENMGTERIKQRFL